MERSVVVPTVHWNGSGAGVLLKELQLAEGALAQAVELLVGARPHPRDYFLQGAKAVEAALRGHAGRVASLRAVVDELRLIRRGIERQRRQPKPASVEHTSPTIDHLADVES